MNKNQHPNAAEALLNWTLTRADGRIVVQHSSGAFYAAAKEGDSGIAESILYMLADSLLSATHSPAHIEDEREACERWIRQQIGMPARIPMDWDGPFNRYTWAAWSARAALSAPPAAGVPEEWQPMETAPTDGTLLRLLVEFEVHPIEDGAGPFATVGTNYRDNTGEDAWQIVGWCWEQDRFIDGVGTPVGWLPMLASAPTPPASEQQRAVVMSPAAADVLAERRRQVEDEQWTPAHDDRYRQRQLAMAAACYAAAVPVHDVLDYSDGQIEKRVPAMPSAWPWAASWWKPGTARKNLVRAGALILAEIERLDRKQQASPREGEQ